MLACLLCWFGWHLVIYECLNMTHCVRCFTKIHLDCFMILPVTKSDTMSELIYCVDCGYIWSLKSDLIKHSLLGISIRFILFFCMILRVKIVDTMCYLKYCIYLGYILSLNSYLRKHSVLATLPTVFSPVNESDTMC